MVVFVVSAHMVRRIVTSGLVIGSTNGSRERPVYREKLY